MTVVPVIDYEPPAGPAERPAPPPRAVCRALPPHRPRAAARAGQSARHRDAARFAEAALRAVLEAVDRRRQPGQLRALLAGRLLDAVDALRHRVDAGAETAVLRRVRLQAVDPAETAFEVAASYARGPRVHAIAARIGPAPGTRWRVTALHIG